MGALPSLEWQSQFSQLSNGAVIPAAGSSVPRPRSSSVGTSPKNTWSQDKPKPPVSGGVANRTRLRAPLPARLVPPTVNRKLPGLDGIPGSEGGQTRAFLDGDQAGAEAVRNAPWLRRRD